jgi:hypothetical protein
MNFHEELFEEIDALLRSHNMAQTQAEAEAEAKSRTEAKPRTEAKAASQMKSKVKKSSRQLKMERQNARLYRERVKEGVIAKIERCENLLKENEHLKAEKKLLTLALELKAR